MSWKGPRPLFFGVRKLCFNSNAKHEVASSSRGELKPSLRKCKSPVRLSSLLPRELLDAEVKTIVISTTGIEAFAASRTTRFAQHILMNRQLRAAGTAKDRSPVKVALGPNLDRMIGESIVTVLTRIVDTAAPCLDGQDVVWAVIMLAARPRIEMDATNSGRTRNDCAPSWQIT